MQTGYFETIQFNNFDRTPALGEYDLVLAQECHTPGYPQAAGDLFEFKCRVGLGNFCRARGQAL